jgi:hypothetical protein
LPKELEQPLEVESKSEDFNKVNKIADVLSQNAKFITNINEASNLRIGDDITHKATSNTAES